MASITLETIRRADSAISALGIGVAKPAAGKQSVVIGLKFTPSQAKTLKEKAGLVPVATYMKDEIFKQTDLFN